ncbi:MurR/RpiR family transcriptional regulator [Paraburkholderia tropica]|uniref:MurR/RpiR family transcriptional regulator n=1 Tax=Paraburkholderia tropica TaxID=92647 RepID=UPI002AB6273E|nr:MurR/RpiR family transcriptional regulator [Paraburkholderia tropica]
MTATQTILDAFPSLSPRLQVAARFIIDHPNEVVISSMRTLAERANSQPATFVRLARQLGFAGWPELKTAFATDMGLHHEGYGEKARSLANRGPERGMLDEMLGVLQTNLDDTLSHSTEVLRKVAALLAKAPHVHIAGFRASVPIAYALFYGYRLFRQSVSLLDGQLGALELQSRSIGKSDAVVIVSFAPYSRESLAVAETARRAGAKVVAITDSSASPLALDAHLSTIFSVNSPSFFPSVVAGVGLVEGLLELLVAAGGRPVVNKINEAERGLFDSGAYLSVSTKHAAKRAPS